MFGHYSMFYAGVVINYAGSIDTVAADMQDRRPTMMASVPRLYEKIYVAGAGQRPGRSRRPAPDLRVGPTGGGGRGWSGRSPARRSRPTLALQRRIADRLVFAKLRARTGGRDPLLHLGRRAALRRDRQVLLRRRHADPGGLRADRDLAGDGGEHLRPHQARHRRPADPGGGGPDRRRRRDRDPRAQRHARLLREAARRRRRPSTRRGGSTPATSACSTPRGTCGSPTARRT